MLPLVCVVWFDISHLLTGQKCFTNRDKVSACQQGKLCAWPWSEHLSSGWVGQCDFDKISEEICVSPLAYRVESLFIQLIEKKSSFFVCLVFFYSWSNRLRTFHSLVKKKQAISWICVRPYRWRLFHGLRNHSVRTLYSNTFNATKKSSALLRSCFNQQR